MEAHPKGTGQATPSHGERLELTWLRPIGMVTLSIANFFYRIVTLGIYDFWARTEVRKRLWSAIRINGEPLVYTGTGKELFLGFLIVFGVVLLPILIFTVAVVLIFGPNSMITGLIQFTLYLAIFFLVGVAIYRAQRYRLLRTSWRGIRGNLEGSSRPYALTYFFTLLAIPLTLGWIIPWRTTKLQSLITNNVRFGSEAFSFRGTSGPLYGPFALLWFGVLALFLVASVIMGLVIGSIQGSLAEGVEPSDETKQSIALVMLLVIALAYVFYLFISAWYRSRTINHFAACTHFDAARFKGTVTGAGLLWIDITNLAILISGSVLVLLLTSLVVGGVYLLTPAMIPADPESMMSMQVLAATIAGPILIFVAALSFTLLLPVTQARSMGYLFDNLALEGTVDVNKISQSTADPMTTGEGLAQAFDIDAF